MTTDPDLSLAAAGQKNNHDLVEAAIASDPLDYNLLSGPARVTAKGREQARPIPSLRAVSDSSYPSVLPPASSSSIRELNAAARNPRATPTASTLLTATSDSDVLARVRDFHQRRMQKGPSPSNSFRSDNNAVGQPGSLRMPDALRPNPGTSLKSAPIPPSLRPKPTLSERRMGGIRLNGAGSPVTGAPKLSDMHGSANGPDGAQVRLKSKLEEFSKYVDAERGWLTFDGAATITNKGVNFANGHTFSISLDEIQVLGELGKGNYGTVFKVRHARPRIPRLGPGPAGVNSRLVNGPAGANAEPPDNQPETPSDDKSISGRVMAMKEIRLELDDIRFAAILKEMFILHECVSPYVVDFYGAFFQEGAVYLCMEYMDGGSLDKLYVGGIPESVLRSITYATVLGLKGLKDELNIIHRDVKPTNILANTAGQVKICDFGVSGSLVASIARTNVGCQSYMAPERIAGGGAAASLVGGGPAGTYSVQSDIWSLGLTMIECALGRYPYPPEVSSTIFSQLSAIVDGEPPNLPADSFSATAQDFVRGCLHKNPKARPTYAMLLQHPWLKAIHNLDPAEGISRLSLDSGDPAVAAWVCAARNPPASAAPASLMSPPPALHKAPLDVSNISH